MTGSVKNWKAWRPHSGLWLIWTHHHCPHRRRCQHAATSMAVVLNCCARVGGEYTPPALTITKTSVKTGRMDMPVRLDDAMEEMTCSFKIYGYDPALLSLFGMQEGSTSPRIIARQAYATCAGQNWWKSLKA
ncbi:phage major tail tube protein [Citrobacter sp. CtB7.12]|uniref:phage major tail tube protein n=1 Tax=Citrobacter sp. CtB7.12 TaxID=1696093 RepID=UPI000AF19DF4|nr:phage major tail tube protein [Citrobacter sp. CtB7.12]